MFKVKAWIWIELALCITVMTASSVWATRFWNEWMSRGGEPAFYQSQFEAAVMIACGHGFVVTQGGKPPALDDFLERRRDALSCSDIPANQPLGQDGIIVRPWRYLMYFVGLSWRILGVSWRGMGPSFGFLFGVSVALVYGLCRLAMSRLPSLGVAFAVSVSTLHLLNLPHLRDFAKEPFTLALFLILGLLVTRPPTYRWVAGLAGAYGVVLGLGYGFRTDFLIDIPLFFLVLALFVEGGPLRHLKVKLAGAAAFVAAFLLVGGPILSAVYRQGGCQWHVVLLGLTAPFDADLHIAPAPYDFGQPYQDGYVEAEVSGYARRQGLPTPEFCSHEYDTLSGAYLSTIVRTFPADFITRAFASVLQVVELPFFRRDPPLANWHPSLYDARETLLGPGTVRGVYAVGAAVLLVSGSSVRLGLFLLFFVLFVGGYPALQFQSRHAFPLEFIGWFALGLLVNHAVLGLWSLRDDARRRLGAALRGAGRAALVAGATSAALVGALAFARGYQERRAGALLNSYLAAAHVPVDLVDPATLSETIAGGPQLLDVELNLPACAPRQNVSFRYKVSEVADFSRTVAIKTPAGVTGTARVFATAFTGFTGIELTPPAPGCVARISRLADVGPFPLLLNATLVPGWEGRGLHQRLADWEHPPVPAFVAMPPISTWAATPGVKAGTSASGRTVVDGDNTATGYQMTAPPVRVADAATVRVSTDFSLERGRACLGALNYNYGRFLAPADAARSALTFDVDATGGFTLVVANCGGGPGREASRFSLSRASYSVDSTVVATTRRP